MFKGNNRKDYHKEGYSHEYYLKNKERYRENLRNWRMKQGEDYYKEEYKKIKEQRKNYQKEYAKRPEVKIRKYNYAKKLTDHYRELIFNMLGNVCKKCGFSDKRALQIDHVNGGGSKQRKQLKSTIKIYKYVLEHP